MSGASGKVPAAIHLTPEAARGGALAKLRDGDIVRLDWAADTPRRIVAGIRMARARSRRPRFVRQRIRLRARIIRADAPSRRVRAARRRRVVGFGFGMSAAPKSRETLAWCEQAAVIPVLRIDDVESGVEIARALFEGGLPIIEITFRTAAAPAALAACARALPLAIFAAGSVRRPQQLRVAKDAGARFAVSPGWREDLSQADILPLLPGAATAFGFVAGGFRRLFFRQVFSGRRRPAESRRCALSPVLSPISDSAQPAASRRKTPSIICPCRMSFASAARGLSTRAIRRPRFSKKRRRRRNWARR